MTKYQKAEHLLLIYNDLQDASSLTTDKGDKASKALRLIDKALSLIAEDETVYAGLLIDLYIDGLTRNQCANKYDCEPITITRNKKRLIHKLSNILFLDEVIEELLS